MSYPHRRFAPSHTPLPESACLGVVWPLVIGLTIGLLAFGTTAPAAADWLVTIDGERIETRGAWEVRGRQIIFTQTNGNLASMRASAVDLDASRAATAAALDKPAPPTDAPAEAVLVLTNQDVPTVRRLLETDSDSESSSADADPDSAAQAPGDGRVEVADWQEQLDPSLLEPLTVTGHLVNKSGDLATDISLEMSIFDEQGTELGTLQAHLDQSHLTPGDRTGFSVEFPGVYRFSAAQFRVKSKGLKVRTEPASDATDGASTGSG